MTKKRITQQQLAGELKVTQASVNQRLNAELEVDSVEFLQAVAKLTGVSLEYLINGTSEPYREGDSPNAEVAEPNSNWINKIQESEVVISEQRERIKELKKYIAMLEDQLKGRG